MEFIELRIIIALVWLHRATDFNIIQFG